MMIKIPENAGQDQDRDTSKKRVPEISKKAVKDPDNVNALFATLQTEDGGVLTDGILKLCAGKTSAPTEVKDFDLAVKTLFEMEPRSPLERSLMTQMIQVQNAAAWCLNVGFNAKSSHQERKDFLGMATKFHRTYVAQIDALQKLRGQGGQKITVEHVTVNAGGQAIVGNVEHTATGGRDGEDNGK